MGCNKIKSQHDRSLTIKPEKKNFSVGLPNNVSSNSFFRFLSVKTVYVSHREREYTEGSRNKHAVNNFKGVFSNLFCRTSRWNSHIKSEDRYHGHKRALQVRDDRKLNILKQITKNKVKNSAAVLDEVTTKVKEPIVYLREVTESSSDEGPSQINTLNAVSDHLARDCGNCSALEFCEEKGSIPVNSALLFDVHIHKEPFVLGCVSQELCTRKRPTNIIELIWAFWYFYFVNVMYLMTNGTCMKIYRTTVLDFINSECVINESFLLRVIEIYKCFSFIMNNFRRLRLTGMAGRGGLTGMAERRRLNGMAERKTDVDMTPVHASLTSSCCFLIRIFPVMKLTDSVVRKSTRHIWMLGSQNKLLIRHNQVTIESNLKDDASCDEKSVEGRRKPRISPVQSQSQKIKEAFLDDVVMLEKQGTERKETNNEITCMKTLTSDSKTKLTKQMYNEASKEDIDSVLSTFKVKQKNIEKTQDDSSLFYSVVKNVSDLQPCSLLRDNIVNMLSVHHVQSRQQTDTVHGLPWDAYEQEAMRLASYRHYPRSAAKSPLLLAASGFVYIGNGTTDKVKCFFCSGEMEGWQASDNVDEIHMSLDPLCPLMAVLTSNSMVLGVSLTPASAATSNIAQPDAAAAATSLKTAQTDPDNYESSYTNSVDNLWDTFSVFTSVSPGHDIDDTVEVDGMTEESQSSQTNQSNAGNQTQGSSSFFLSSIPNLTSRSEQGPSRSATAGSDSGSNQSQLIRPSQSSLSVLADSTAENPRNNFQLTSNSLIANGTSCNNQSLTGSQICASPQAQQLHPVINSKIYSIPVRPVNILDASSLSNATAASSQHQPSTSRHESQPLSYQTLGIFHEKPKHAEYSILARRLHSFAFWPEDHPIRPQDLARAGLFYAGYGDSCRCFFCGLGLKNWEPEDNPLVEHARHFDDCSYIHQIMGQDFVEAVRELKTSNPTVTYGDVVEKMRSKRKEIHNLLDDPVITNDAAVKSILDEGYSIEAIQQAVRSLKEKGLAISADLILTQINEEENNSVAGTVKTLDDDDKGILQELKHQIDNMRTNLMCKICLDREVQVVFLPCGHLISCQDCAFALLDCPVCRSHIRATVRAIIH